MHSSDHLIKLWQSHLPEFADRAPDLLIYLDCLLETNQKVNLVSRKLSFEDLFVDHILDCGLALPFFKSGTRFLDFGTGGGLPGVVIAICFPDKHVVLFDKSRKKCDYLGKICRDLNLKQTVVTHDPKKIPEATDTLVTRAVGPIPKVFENIQQIFSKYPQRCFFYKAIPERFETELEWLRLNKIDYEIHKLSTPDPNKERHLVEVKIDS